LLFLLTGCQRALLKIAFEGYADYAGPPGYEGTSLDRVTDGVYSFRWSWYRNLAIDTADGWVVTDPFNVEAAQAMHAALDKIAPGKPVHTMIYSHYHRDHVEGGAALQPANVIAHEKCAGYWQQMNASRIAKVTRWISGDETLLLGGVELRLLYLGHSHSETLYAVHLPQKRLVWTADLGLVKAVPPLTAPDTYFAGYRAAEQRIAALDFDIFVPSHFGVGTKKDFIESVAFLDDLEAITRAQLAPYDGHPPVDKAKLGQIFDGIYDPMRAKYGGWHGFDGQILPAISRAMLGVMLEH
jgi:glyoxylase-like metal-dependent hydrolase (beta-lactamase superfamily II)